MKGIFSLLSVYFLAGAILALNAVVASNYAEPHSFVDEVLVSERVVERYDNIVDVLSNVMFEVAGVEINITEDGFFITEELPNEGFDPAFDSDVNHAVQFINLFPDDLNSQVDAVDFTDSGFVIQPCDIEYSHFNSNNSGVQYVPGDPYCPEFSGYDFNYFVNPQDFKDVNWVERHDLNGGLKFHMRVEDFPLPDQNFDETYYLDGDQYNLVVIEHAANPDFDAVIEIGLIDGEPNSFRVEHNWVQEAQVTSGPFVIPSYLSFGGLSVRQDDYNIGKGG